MIHFTPGGGECAVPSVRDAVEEDDVAGDRVELPECGVARFLVLLEGPWATLVVRELMPGPRRFGELMTALPGISGHTLTSRLRRFERFGLVTRTAYAEIPPRVVYELTPLGQQLDLVLTAMSTWAEQVPAPAANTNRPEERRPA